MLVYDITNEESFLNLHHKVYMYSHEVSIYAVQYSSV